MLVSIRKLICLIFENYDDKSLSKVQKIKKFVSNATATCPNIQKFHFSNLNKISINFSVKLFKTHKLFNIR